MKILYFILLISNVLLYRNILIGQKFEIINNNYFTEKSADSLLKIIEKSTDNQQIANIYNSIAYQYFLLENHFEHINTYSTAAYNLAIKHNDKNNKVFALLMKSYILAENEEVDSAMLLMLEITEIIPEVDTIINTWYKGIYGLVLFRNNDFYNAHKYISEVINEFQKFQQDAPLAYFYRICGRIFFALGDYVLALENFEISSNIYKSINYKKSVSINKKFIGRCFELLQKYQTALNYYKEAINGIKNYDDPKELCYLFTILSNFYISKSQIRIAKSFQDSCFEIAKKFNDNNLLGLSYNNYGEIFMASTQYSVALINFLHATQYYHNSENIRYLIVTKLNIARCYLELSDLKNAQFYAELALKYSINQHRKNFILKSLEILSKISAITKDFNKAYDYLILANTYRDSIVNIQNIEKVALMEIKYESEKKENQIKQLKFDNEVKTIQLQKERIKKLILLNILAFIVIFITIISFRYIRRADQRFSQEQFKYRDKIMDSIARELHDDVGGDIRGLRIAIEANTELTDNKFFMSNYAMLLSSIHQKVRNLSVELKSPDLSSFNIYKQINLHLQKYRTCKDMNISFIVLPSEQFINLLDKKLQVEMFRVAQEAINNAFKHAKATKLNVSLSKHQNNIVLMVEDNGCGFSDKIQGGGMGLKNMKSRIKSLGGNFSVESQLGMGTLILAEVPISKNKIKSFIIRLLKISKD